MKIIKTKRLFKYVSKLDDKDFSILNYKNFEFIYFWHPFRNCFLNSIRMNLLNDLIHKTKK